MSDTILVSIIGGLSTIIVPIVTWFLTSKSKEKEKNSALDSMQKDHEHELEKLKFLHSHELATKEKDFELAVAKLKAETENTKDLDQAKLLNNMISPFFQAQLENPDSVISKVVNQEIQEATKQKSRNFIRNK